MFEFRIKGFDEAEQKFEDLKGGLQRISPALSARVKDILQKAYGRVFDAQGIPRWVKLSPWTLREKERAGYGGQPILVRTGTLRRSYVGESPYSRWTTTRTSVVFENRLARAIFHEAGSGRLPRRSVIKGILEQKLVRQALQKAIVEEALKS